jgi:Zn-dependent M28 family amino/carboxypeptidase
MSPRLRAALIAAVLVVSSLPIVASAGEQSCDTRNNNTIDKLLECVTVDGVREHQAALQSIADANDGIRTAGTEGYNQSAAYVAQRLEAAGYDVTLQEFDFQAFVQLGPSTLEQVAPGAVPYLEGVDYDLMSQTDAGDVTGAIEGVDLALGTLAWPNVPSSSTSGCDVADFAAFTPGNIALVQRGACSFQLKAENAADAGAIGAIVFNQGNTPARMGLINGTLGSTYSGGIPVMEASFPSGAEWADTAGLTMHMIADVLRGSVPTANVIAESPSGDPSNVVMAGAHLDSVSQGPGIQDNGSGSAALLEVAEQMAKVNPRNKVRFAWWTAEESGLVGSTYYVNSLTEDEQDDISLYLNFDMIGSPNHVFFVYDGDDSDGVGAGPGPEGSAQIEEFYENYYDGLGVPYKGTDFSGRSDYGPFIAVGIPAGGLFTGAEGIKTPDEAALWGGTAGDQYDPCYHLACDTFDNINLTALDVNSDAVAASVLTFAMNTEDINGERGKGNFKPQNRDFDPTS